MKVYKLQYPNKETALTDLIAKGVYTLEDLHESGETLCYGQGIQAIVEIGLIVQTEPTFDDEGNVLTDPIYFNGYHYDVMSENIITFENEIEVNNPKHTFAGYEQKRDIGQDSDEMGQS
jgi:hypothetical protein